MARAGLVLLVAVVAGFAWSRARADTADDYIAPDDDYVGDESDPFYSTDAGDDVDLPENFSPSPELEAMLKKGEALRLTPYRLGDGGSTLGYGRYFPDGGPPPPASITPATADDWFDEDIEARAARWVRQYVTVPLTQFQFDALCSMAFNLKPSSFATIAAAVNAGDDPEAAALKYVREGTNLERGLRIRRARELALYRDGLYS